MENVSPSPSEISTADAAAANGAHREDIELDEAYDRLSPDEHSPEPQGADQSDIQPKKRSKTTAERLAAKGKKAGNPGTFRGKPFDFLTALLPEFIAVRAIVGHGKMQRMADFRTATIAQFWGRFSWTELAHSGELQEKTIERVNNVSHACVAMQGN